MGISRQEALCVYVLAGLLVAGSAVLFWRSRSSARVPVIPTPTGQAAGSPADGSASPGSVAVDSQSIIVHISGAVGEPGVYSLARGDRVIDAVAAAGGTTEDAVTDALNLASKLEDGQKVHVPSRKEVQSGAVVRPGGQAVSAGRINLNRATLEQLDTLPGIGPGLAAAIIEYRTRAGGFRKIEDLMKVGGIGPKTFERLKNLVTAD